ncbi:MAG TPA: family 78 glycoside hydrolase catalytic domain [Fimbriimonadaceae bacterium]|nr:family 78 glycoside hydrolase catalytic domain [Fimbriimonadaceae bacterium]
MWRGPCLAILLLPMPAWSSASSYPTMTADDLRCEYRSEPLGIDAAHPRLSWVLRCSPEQRGQEQTAYRILVASSASLLNRNRGDLWDSGAVSSRDQNNVGYAGTPLRSGQTCYWKVRVWSGDEKPTWSRPARWEMGLLRPSDWLAQWIDDGRRSPATDEGFYADDPAPLFRKEFTARAPISRARLYITGLGYYEASLNGKRVGDHVLDPGWTKFDRRTLYSVYDVTRALGRGKNCLGVMLGNGWYNPLPLRLFGQFNLREHLATGRPRLLAQLHIEYRDGSVETIASDPTWKVGEGPILRNNIYLGELYDARREQPGWDRPGFDDSRWRAPAIAAEKVGQLVAQSQPPIRVTSQWASVHVTQPKPGVFIYDCGVNFAGWVRLKLNLSSGAVIRLRYGELLNSDGTLNPMTSVAGQIKGRRGGTSESVGGPGAPDIAWQGDTFVARGGPETYTPRFTFHGFRYVEISGLEAALPLKSVTALRLNADVEDAGAFECSNSMLNEIQAICRRTFKSNIFSVQSDCPHRERLGYGGDIVATSEALMGNFDMSGFYEKVVRDWSDSALPDGMFTDTAPFIGIQYCGVIWAMAHPVLIDQLHRYYGDRQIGEEEYEAAKRWLLLVEKQYPDGIVKEGLSDHEGLEPAPAPEMVTPLYYQCAKLLSAEAGRLSRKEDESHFQQLAQMIRAEYGSRFIDGATGKVGPGTQASQAFALYTGIAPEAVRPKILDYLLRDIEAHKGHLSTGILGTKFMLDVLSREGHADVAYRIVTQPDFPGWGWMLKNGATTLWEHWAFSDNTFSHNHPMFGSVSQWMMNWLGGIQPEPDAAGFDRIVIRPQTPSGLDWVKSSYRSIRGKIVSNWTREGKVLKFEFEIPANTRARICLPAMSGEAITENGRPLPRTGATAGHPVEVTVGSGHYAFAYRLT